jgi:hypothetical protein
MCGGRRVPEHFLKFAKQHISHCGIQDSDIDAMVQAFQEAVPVFVTYNRWGQFAVDKNVPQDLAIRMLGRCVVFVFAITFSLIFYPKQLLFMAQCIR